MLTLLLNHPHRFIHFSSYASSPRDQPIMSHHNLFGLPADILGLVVESISWWKDICRLRTTCRRARRGAIGRFVPQYHAARRAAWNQPFHRCGLHEVNITNEVKDTSIGERRRSFIEVLIDPSGARDERPLAPSNTCLDLSICTQLQVLRLSHTNLWHVLSLPRYTNLRVLDLSYTACGFRIDAQTNLCGLSECSNLVTLDLTHFGRGGLHRGPIYAQMPYLDLRPLSKCTRLQTLMLYHARVNDISPLCWCTQLCFIDLSYTAVTSLESLQDCHDLRCVLLEGMEHTVQWYFNAAMTSLRELYFEHSIVVDLTLISLCVHIETIDLRECIILNIQGLKNCRTLKCLYLDGSTVTDISILATCTSLQILSLAKTRVSDIEALRSCKQLKSIDLYGTMVKDVSALLSCPNLYYTGMRRDSIPGLWFHDGDDPRVIYQTNVEREKQHHNIKIQTPGLARFLIGSFTNPECYFHTTKADLLAGRETTPSWSGKRNTAYFSRRLLPKRIALQDHCVCHARPFWRVFKTRFHKMMTFRQTSRTRKYLSQYAAFLEGF